MNITNIESSIKTLENLPGPRHRKWTGRDKQILNSVRIVWEDMKKAPVEYFKKFIELDVKDGSADLYIEQIKKHQRPYDKLGRHFFDNRISNSVIDGQERAWKEKIERTAAWQNILGLYREGHTFSWGKNCITIDPNPSKLTCLNELAQQLKIEYETQVKNETSKKLLPVPLETVNDKVKLSPILKPALKPIPVKIINKNEKKREPSQLEEKAEKPTKKIPKNPSIVLTKEIENSSTQKPILKESNYVGVIKTIMATLKACKKVSEIKWEAVAKLNKISEEDARKAWENYLIDNNPIKESENPLLTIAAISQPIDWDVVAILCNYNDQEMARLEWQQHVYEAILNKQQPIVTIKNNPIQKDPSEI